jgi:hypothetical protein
MTLGRMIHFFLPDQKLVGITARRFGVIFVCLDIFAFLVQAAGALMSSAQEGGSLLMTGLHIYMGGIGLQEAFILCFAALAIDLHRKLIRMENSEATYNGKLNRGPFSWKWLFYALYFALGMITVSRCNLHTESQTKANAIDLLLTKYFEDSNYLPTRPVRPGHLTYKPNSHARVVRICIRCGPNASSSGDSERDSPRSHPPGTRLGVPRSATCGEGGEERKETAKENGERGEEIAEKDGQGRKETSKEKRSR